jgi:hypothetical protein
MAVLIQSDEVCIAHVVVTHADIFVFVGDHPVGDCTHTNKARHCPQGWAPQKMQKPSL